MNEHPISELVSKYFAAYSTGDRRSIEALLTRDFTFTSPYEDHIDRATYVERCGQLAGTYEYHDLRTTIVSDRECFVLYESRSKSGNVHRNVELLTFRGDRLESVEVFVGRPPYLFTAASWSQPSMPMALTPSGV